MPIRLPNLLASKAGRLIAFFFLYVTEGVPLGFTATAIATQMRRQGVGPKEIGIFVGTLYLPWAWKWLIGPFVDVIYSDRLGRRRAWIVATQVLMAGSLLVAMGINFSAELKVFTAVILVLNMFGATQDVAIDALACNVLKEEERGLANGLMFAGAYAGQGLGGAGVLFLAEYMDFGATFFYVAGAILTITVFVALPLKEPKTVQPEGLGGVSLRVAVSEIRRYCVDAVRSFFGSRSAVFALVFALLPAGAYSLSLALQSNLAVELGLSDAKIGVLALMSTLISAIGCVIGGFLSDRLGRRQMLGFYLAGTAIPTLFLGWVMFQEGWIMPIDPNLPDRPVPPEVVIQVFWIANVVYALFQGLMYGTRTALFMDVCNPAVAATQFTAYMALLNFVIWYSSTWQGWAIERWGYPMTLLMDALLGLVCLVVLPWIRPVASGESESQTTD